MKKINDSALVDVHGGTEDISASNPNAGSGSADEDKPSNVGGGSIDQDPDTTGNAHVGDDTTDAFSG